MKCGSGASHRIAACTGPRLNKVVNLPTSSERKQRPRNASSPKQRPCNASAYTTVPPKQKLLQAQGYGDRAPLAYSHARTRMHRQTQKSTDTRVRDTSVTTPFTTQHT